MNESVKQCWEKKAEWVLKHDTTSVQILKVRTRALYMFDV